MILPIKNITYRTALTQEAAIQRLSENTEPSNSSFMTRLGSTKLYKGEITGNTFKIHRKIYRRSLLPTIKGVIEDHHSGTIIKVTLGLPLYIVLFLIFFGICFLFGLSVASDSVRINEPAFGSSILTSGIFPIIMLVFVTVISIGSFAFESNKARKDLQTFFEADIIGG